MPLLTLLTLGPQGKGWDDRAMLKDSTVDFHEHRL